MIRKVLFLIVFAVVLLTLSFAEGMKETQIIAEPEFNMADPCIACHISVTPGILHSFGKSKHMENNVNCQACHTAHSDDPTGINHNGYKITAVPSPKYCQECHPKEVAQNNNSKHAWTAFMGQYKPYYAEARKRGLDPLSQETAKLLVDDHKFINRQSDMGIAGLRTAKQRYHPHHMIEVYYMKNRCHDTDEKVPGLY